MKVMKWKEDKPGFIGTCLLSLVLFVSICACAASHEAGTVEQPAAQPFEKSLTRVSEVDSFNPVIASRQALEVLKNNSYSRQLFEDVFEKVVLNLRDNKNEKNYDLIWENLIEPLARDGVVPPDLAKRTWNEYFSFQFSSLPQAAFGSNCNELAAIKNEMIREYKRKALGFEVSKLGSVDEFMGKAMSVYDTMWAACNDPAKALQ